MNLQQLLNYRPICFIHQQPMNVYIRPEIREYGILSQQTDTGLYIWRKGNKPLCGAHFDFDGEYHINKNQSVLTRFLHSPYSPFIVGMMCKNCRSTPNIHHHIKADFLTINNIKNRVHFYSFLIDTEGNFAGKYACHGGLEIIKYCSGDRFYQMRANIGGGIAHFMVGSCGKDIKLPDIISSMLDLTTPQFDPANLKSLDQFIEKMKLYNLFS